MKRVALASLLLVVTIVQSGCILGCGGFEGAGNRVYQRNDEMLILCDNGGFVAKLADRMVEGFYTDNGDGITGTATNGEDGALAFNATVNTDYTLSTPELGTTVWSQMNLDATALDHSDVLCQDLQYRAWWTAQ